VLLIIVTLLFLGVACDKLFDNYSDEEFDMEKTDKQAVTLHTDSSYISVKAAKFDMLTHTHIHFDTVTLLLEYYDVRFDTSQQISGEDTSEVIDTLYQFSFDTTISVYDLIKIQLTHGDSIILNYDTSYVYIANVEGTNETYMLSKVFTLSKTFTLSDYYIITTSEIDTLPVTAYTDILDSLTATTVLIDQDTSCVFSVNITKTPIENYLCFEVPVCDEVTFFTTDYVYIKIFDEEMQEIPYISNAMPLGTFSLYSYYDESKKKVFPHFKERFSYKLDDSRYFLRIDATEQTSKTQFELAIIFD